MPIQIKRAYEDVADDDGIRILVDRIWPRGVSKEKLHIDHWIKGVAPSTQLRKWFNHEPEKFAAFKNKYKEELHSEKEQSEQLEELKKIVIQHKKNVTLIYSAKDHEHNQAVVLKEILDRGLLEN